MIVAHPDDESIFGGNHILNEKFFIVCLTNKDNEVRRKEFYEMLEKSGNEGIILSYPDKTNGKRDNWEKDKESIYKTIYEYVNKKDWDKIVTHNKKGEYGHIHHKMVNEMVTKASIESNKSDVLYYFGEYYTKDKIKNRRTMNDTELARKEELISVYKSQKKTREKLKHSYKYENWQKKSK